MFSHARYSRSRRFPCCFASFGILSLGLALACSSAPVQKRPPEAPTQEKPAPEIIERPALTADEEVVAKKLKTHIEHLSTKIGERNPEKIWELAEASDYLANQLEDLGFKVERQGYEIDGKDAQNLSITIYGGARVNEVLILGAHYDSPLKDSGQDAGGSGAAALLELARMMQDAQLLRSLRLVFFALGESPHGVGNARGAKQFAEKLIEDGKRPPDSALPGGSDDALMQPLGFVHLDRLGTFPNPHESLPDGIYVRMTSSPGADKIRSSFEAALEGDPVRLDPYVVDWKGHDSDPGAFVSVGIPSLAISGQKVRNGGDDTPAPAPGGELQYDEMAQVVMRLRYGIGQILGEKPSNDGMVTPLSGQLR